METADERPPRVNPAWLRWLRASTENLLTTRHLLILGDVAILILYLSFATDHRVAFFLSTVLTITLFASGGLYEPRLHLSLLDDLPSLATRLLVAMAIVVGVVAATDAPATSPFVYTLLVGAIAHLFVRSALQTFVRWARRRGLVAHRTLVIGGGQVAGQLMQVLGLNREYGLVPIGCVDSQPPMPSTLEHAPWLGVTDELEALIVQHDIDIIVVAFGHDREVALVDLIRRRAFAKHEVFIIPRMFEMDVRSRPGDHIGVLPIVRLPRRAVEGPKWRVKRGFDIVAASLALAVLFPFLALVALAVRIEGGPGVIFRQVRIGQDGQPFELYKFRSMKPVEPGGGDVTWTIVGNPRVGPVGKILRATSIDELPQLWNIVKGDMTIVGPRPERPYFVTQFTAQYPRYQHRHRVPVGLTGLAQVSGLRGNTSIGDRAMYDNFYIESWSFWLDIKVILRTVREVLRGGGAG